MLKIQLIGVGQGANNASIYAIEKGVVKREDVLLINTTLKDIPADYRERSIKFGDYDGMGKQRELGKEVVLQSIEDGTADILNNFIKSDTDIVVVAGTTAGGTGSGMTLTLASYIEEVLNKKVICVAFTGSHNDSRGLLNTVGFFKDIPEDLTIMVISNEKFVKEANGNLMKIHKLANESFVQKLNIISGKTIVDSSYNMDDSDLFKSISLPGLLTAEFTVLDRNMKNIEQYNKAISDMLSESKSIDVKNPNSKRISVIFNVDESTQENIDFNHTILKEKLGDAPEIYNHIQYESDVEFINVIASGMRLPLEEVKDIYERYKEKMKNFKVNDDFFSEIENISDEFGMNKFDSRLSGRDDSSKKSKDNFLSKMNKKKNSQVNQEGEDILSKY